MTYPWTPVPSFYIHLCLRALQGGIWPHTAAYFWGLHCNYYNGQLCFQIGGEFGENPFYSHVFSIIFSSFLHTPLSNSKIYHLPADSTAGWVQLITFLEASSKFLIFILTLALCFLPPGYRLWAWSLLRDGSVLYCSYLLHIRYGHLWINWKTLKGVVLEGKPMPGAVPEFLPVGNRQLQSGSIHSYCCWNGSMKL